MRKRQNRRVRLFGKMYSPLVTSIGTGRSCAPYYTRTECRTIGQGLRRKKTILKGTCSYSTKIDGEIVSSVRRRHDALTSVWTYGLFSLPTPGRTFATGITSSSTEDGNNERAFVRHYYYRYLSLNNIVCPLKVHVMVGAGSP